MNKIVNLKTLDLESADGPVTAIVMGLNIPDLRTADSFIEEAAEKFKLHRTCSSPNTSILLITVVSKMSAAHFIECWRRQVARDPILAFYMTQMRKADVLVGTFAGENNNAVSLLE